MAQVAQYTQDADMGQPDDIRWRSQAQGWPSLGRQGSAQRRLPQGWPSLGLSPCYQSACPLQQVPQTAQAHHFPADEGFTVSGADGPAPVASSVTELIQGGGR